MPKAIPFQVKDAEKAFEELGKIKKNTWKEMKGTFGQFKGIAGCLSPVMSLVKNLKFFNPILKPLQALLKVLLTSVFKPLMPLFNTIGKSLLELMPLIEKLGTTIGKGLAEILEKFMPIIVRLIEEVAPPIIEILIMIIDYLVEFIPLLDVLLDVLEPLIDALVIGVGWLKTFVKWLVGGSPGLIPILLKIYAIVGLYLKSSLNFFFAMFEAIIDILAYINNVLVIVMDLITDMGKILSDVIIDTIESIVKGLEDVADILEYLNDVIPDYDDDDKKKDKDDDDDGIPDWFPPWPFREGGIVTKPTLAIVGEVEPEYIFNEGELTTFVGKVQRGSGKVVNVNINLDNAVITNEQSLLQLVKSIGRHISANIY